MDSTLTLLSFFLHLRLQLFLLLLKIATNSHHPSFSFELFYIQPCICQACIYIMFLFGLARPHLTMCNISLVGPLHLFVRTSSPPPQVLFVIKLVTIRGGDQSLLDAHCYYVVNIITASHDWPLCRLSRLVVAGGTLPIDFVFSAVSCFWPALLYILYMYITRLQDILLLLPLSSTNKPLPVSVSYISLQYMAFINKIKNNNKVSQQRKNGYLQTWFFNHLELPKVNVFTDYTHLVINA